MYSWQVEAIWSWKWTHQTYGSPRVWGLGIWTWCNCRRNCYAKRMTPGTSRKSGWTCQSIKRYKSAKAIWLCHFRFRFFNWDEGSILRDNSRFQSTSFMCLITKSPQCGAISAGLQGCCQSCCWQQFSEAFVPVSVNLPAIFTLCYVNLLTNL